MQYWTSVAAEKTAAREAVAERMEKSYRIPFERFERYTPYGSAEDVAEFLAPYARSGARHFNVTAQAASSEAALEATAEIRERLIALVGADAG